MWKYSIIKLLRLRKISITGMVIIIMSIPHISIISNTIIPMLAPAFQVLAEIWLEITIRYLIVNATIKISPNDQKR